MRTLIIGDIHGCFEELLSLLRKVRFNKDKDHIIFNGDLMDRGPFSYDVFSFVISLKEEMGERCSLILGNHEDLLVHSVDSREDKENWRYNGANSTCKSFRKNGKNFQDAIPSILKHFVLYRIVGGVLVSHAGLFMENIEEMDPFDIIWNRKVCNGKTSYPGIQVIGHTPSKQVYCVKRETGEDLFWYNPEPVFLEEGKRFPFFPDTVYNIDGACAYGYNLVCMTIYHNENGEAVSYRIWKEPSRQKEVF